MVIYINNIARKNKIDKGGLEGLGSLEFFGNLWTTFGDWMTHLILAK